MKNIFRLIIALHFIIPAFGQTGFPVKVDQTYFDKTKDALNSSQVLKERGTVKDISVNNIQSLILQGIARVTHWSGNNFTATPGTVTAGVGNPIGSGIVIRPGKKIIITSIAFGCSGAALVQTVPTVDAANNWYPYLGFSAATDIVSPVRITHVFGANGGSIEKAIPGGVVMYENSLLSFSYTSVDATADNVSWTVTGIEIPNEINLEAKFRIAIYGDSTAWGANLGNDEQGRAFLGNSQWSETFRDLARQNGIDAKIHANMAEDGRAWRDGFYGMQTGYLAIECDLGFVSYGMNDATLLKYPTEAKFKEYVSGFINKFKKVNPGKPLVLLAPVGTDDPDRTSANRILNIRTWLQSVATDTASGFGVTNKVYYVDQSLIIPLADNQSTDLNYKNTERAVGWFRVHPSGVGSTAIGTYLWNNLKQALFNK